MDCAPVIALGGPEYMASFRQRAIEGTVPLAGQFDLTYRCNLRCVHCYCDRAAGPAGAGELGTEDVLRLLGEAAEAGCLSVLLSGGEPLLRPDFAEIYVGACRLGLLVTVFTNGTLVDQRTVEVFREYPPRLVEVSLYGASADTYGHITGASGAFARTWAGVHMLLDAGVRVALKTMMLRDNIDDFVSMQRAAEELGLRFRSDPIVTPRLNGDLEPLVQRVDPRLATSLAWASEEILAEATRFRDRQLELEDNPRLYRCGAGVISFHLDPYGLLRPCMMTQDDAFDATNVGFAAAWRRAVASLEGLRRRDDSKCIECPDRALCGSCPGLFALESGSPHTDSPYVCGLGKERSAMLGSNIDGGDGHHDA